MPNNNLNLHMQIEELKQQVAILEQALTATDVHFTVHDRQGRYLYVNPIGLTAQNLRPEDVFGKTWRELGFPEEVGIPFDERIERVFTEGGSITTEVTFPSVDGMRVYESVLQPAYDNEGNVVAAVSSHKDITEKREAEEALHKSNAELQARTDELAAALDTAKQLQVQAEKANRAKDAFLASMSHELRTPLNGILGYAQILKRDAETTDQQQAGLNVIEQSGKHLLNLINDVLDLAKIESGKIELYETDFSLSGLLQDVGDLTQMRANRKGLDFNLDYPEERPIYVHGDERRLRQVLLNLLSNAVKFTMEGQVTLRVKLQRSATKNDEAHKPSSYLFQVEDTGIGIAAKDVQAIFKPFQQTGGREHRIQGTGLGLAISRNLVRLMGGELQVRSAPNQGSLFWFEITLPELVDQGYMAVQETRKIAGIHSFAGEEGQVPTILIVDDNKENLGVLVNLLTPLGFEILQAENGHSGLALAVQELPDAVITDLVMPELDGYALIQQIRQSDNIQKCVIIATSASVFDKDRQKSLDVGGDSFLPKPIEADQLFTLLEKLLHLTWQYEESEQTIDQVGQSTELLLPPDNVLQELLDLVEIGYIVEFKNRLAVLEDTDKQYSPFVSQIDRLAAEFELNAISELLTEYLENQIKM